MFSSLWRCWPGATTRQFTSRPTMPCRAKSFASSTTTCRRRRWRSRFSRSAWWDRSATWPSGAAHHERAQIFDAWALAGAEVGVVFCTVVLITGPIWGRRAWGIWWTWDARLTTTLVLWLIYVSYLLLRRFAAGSADADAGRRAGHLRRARRAHRLHVEPLVAHAASRAGLRRQRRARAWIRRWWARSCGTCWRGLLWGVLILALRYRVERQQQRIAAVEEQRALEA